MNRLRWMVALAVGSIVGGGMAKGEAREVGIAGAGSDGVVISAVFADGYAAGGGDEAVQLWNVGVEAVDVGGWVLDDGEGQAAFPMEGRLGERGGGSGEWGRGGPGDERGVWIGAGEWVWVGRSAEGFRGSFGHGLDAAWGGGEESNSVLRMVTVGAGPRLADGGERVELRDGEGRVVDVVVYGEGEVGDKPGWQGEAVRVYAGGAIGRRHQVLYRKLDPGTGRPVGDRDGAEDWASDAEDGVLGRRARFPGWDLEDWGRPRWIKEWARVEVAVAPDGLRDFLRRKLAGARRSIDVAVYSFENPELAELLARKAGEGVRVRILVEGRPVGGIDMAQRWSLARIDAAGGRVWWMDRGGDVGPRYRGMHAKLWLIDGWEVLVGSENPNLGSTPGDGMEDGTAGRRGVYVAVRGEGAARWAEALLGRDMDVEGHVDLRPFQARDPERGAPAEDYEPEWVGGGAGYRPIAAEPLVSEGVVEMEWLSAPESVLDPERGVAALVGRAGRGDVVWVQQLSEPLWWGDGPEEGVVALSPRVQGYLAAARRGASVRVLLDGYFADAGDWNGNHQTVAHLEERAASEGLDLAARLGNPAGKGLHNKMILVSSGCAGRVLPGGGRQPLGCTRWSHVGSLNGTEVASKVNREVALQLVSDPVFGHLGAVFAWDWARSGANAVYLPWIASASASRKVEGRSSIRTSGARLHPVRVQGQASKRPAIWR